MLLNNGYKVLADILYHKLIPYADSVVEEYQYGFRRDRSSTDQIFNVRLILQIGREFNIIGISQVNVEVFKDSFDLIGKAVASLINESLTSGRCFASLKEILEFPLESA